MLPVRAQFVVFGVLSSLLSGCYSHAVLIEVQSVSADTWDQQEIADATAVVERIAGKYGFKPSSNVDRFREVWADQGERSYRVIAAFGREAARRTNWSRILLVAAVDQVDGDFVVFLRDWDSVGPTGFTRSIEEQLVSVLSSDFPTRSVEVRYLRDMPTWYVP